MARTSRSKNRIAEYDRMDAKQFREEILPSGRPAVFRRLVVDWPVVGAARDSVEEVAGYLGGFDQGKDIGIIVAPPETGGRLFYNEDLTDRNFGRKKDVLAGLFGAIERARHESPPETVVAQTIRARDHLPGFEADNPFDLFGEPIEPLLWVGNATIVAPHFDARENIACVVAGRRRFTLFAPDQIGNLYTGPLELTPVNAVVSMASVENPDFERYPRFADALASAWIADLEPGDAIYIPYLWWHGVRATEPFNMLVNFWTSPRPLFPPNTAYLAALLSIRNLPETHRKAWREIFEHNVFRAASSDYLPAHARGVLGTITPAVFRRTMMKLRSTFLPKRQGPVADAETPSTAAASGAPPAAGTPRSGE